MKVEIMDSMWKKTVGLIGKTTLSEDTMWFFPNVARVHTAFMRRAIDVFVLDSEKRVIHIERSLPPWRMTPRVAGATSCIETASGCLTNVRLFDSIVD